MCISPLNWILSCTSTQLGMLSSSSGWKRTEVRTKFHLCSIDLDWLSARGMGKRHRPGDSAWRLCKICTGRTDGRNCTMPSLQATICALWDRRLSTNLQYVRRKNRTKNQTWNGFLPLDTLLRSTESPFCWEEFLKAMLHALVYSTECLLRN